MTDRIAALMDTSESDDSSESMYIQFQQIADIMLCRYNDIISNKHNCPKRKKKRNKESSSNMSENPKQNMDDSKNSWISTRITRHSSK